MATVQRRTLVVVMDVISDNVALDLNAPGVMESQIEVQLVKGAPEGVSIALRKANWDGNAWRAPVAQNNGPLSPDPAENSLDQPGASMSA